MSDVAEDRRARNAHAVGAAQAAGAASRCYSAAQGAATGGPGRESAGPRQALPRPAACRAEGVLRGHGNRDSTKSATSSCSTARRGAALTQVLEFASCARRTRWTTRTTRASGPPSRCGTAGATRPTRTIARRSSSMDKFSSISAKVCAQASSPARQAV